MKLFFIFLFLFKRQEATSGHVIVSNSNSQLVFSVPPHQCYKRFYFSTCLSRQQTNHGLCLCLHQYKKYVYSQNNKYKQVELLSTMFTLNTTAQKISSTLTMSSAQLLIELRENFSFFFFFLSFSLACFRSFSSSFEGKYFLYLQHRMQRKRTIFMFSSSST